MATVYTFEQNKVSFKFKLKGQERVLDKYKKNRPPCFMGAGST